MFKAMKRPAEGMLNVFLNRGSGWESSNSGHGGNNEGSNYKDKCKVQKYMNHDK